jgi:hypothetical protein
MYALRPCTLRLNISTSHRKQNCLLVCFRYNHRRMGTGLQTSSFQATRSAECPTTLQLSLTLNPVHRVPKNSTSFRFHLAYSCIDDTLNLCSGGSNSVQIIGRPDWVRPFFSFTQGKSSLCLEMEFVRLFQAHIYMHFMITYCLDGRSIPSVTEPALLHLRVLHNTQNVYKEALGQAHSPWIGFLCQFAYHQTFNSSDPSSKADTMNALRPKSEGNQSRPSHEQLRNKLF